MTKEKQQQILMQYILQEYARNPQAHSFPEWLRLLKCFIEGLSAEQCAEVLHLHIYAVEQVYCAFTIHTAIDAMKQCRQVG